MSATHGNNKGWKALGQSKTSPTEQKDRRIVLVDDYYVVIAFEVNDPDAYKGGTHDLAIDFGHAFFYVAKNRIVIKVFSFGPKGRGKVGWLDRGNGVEPNAWNTGALIKDGFKNARPGTADYAVGEAIKAFKVPITITQAEKLLAKTEEMRARIDSGAQKYTAYINDTCAEAARGILDDSGISTPSGSGAVKHSAIVNFQIAFAVNPYRWHDNFLKAGYKEVRRPGLVDPNPARMIGLADPVF